MKKSAKKRAGSKKKPGAKKTKSSARAPRKDSRLKKAARTAFRLGGED